MRTKRKNWSWLALLLAVVLCAGFSSCDKDDEEEGESQNSDNSILGYWEWKETSPMGEDSKQWQKECYVFYNNGIYEYKGGGGPGDDFSGALTGWGGNGMYEITSTHIILNCLSYYGPSYYGSTGMKLYALTIDGNNMRWTEATGQTKSLQKITEYEYDDFMDY